VVQVRSGVRVEEAAAGNARAFAGQFVEALSAEPLATLSFPSCFVGGAIDQTAAAAHAAAEWGDWVDGGYAVCLHHFTGATCVQKESLAWAMKDMLGRSETAATLSERLDLLDMAHRLSGMILPFSPEERPVGTPGRTIDRLLKELRLGEALPYGKDPDRPAPIEQAADARCQ
jgi:hypothetical protein